MDCWPQNHERIQSWCLQPPGHGVLCQQQQETEATSPHPTSKQKVREPSLPCPSEATRCPPGASPPPAAVPCGDTVSSPSFSSLGGLGRLHRRLPKEIKCGHMCSSKFSHSRVEKMNRKRVKFILIMHAVSLLHPNSISTGDQGGNPRDVLRGLGPRSSRSGVHFAPAARVELLRFTLRASLRFRGSYRRAVDTQTVCS